MERGRFYGAESLQVEHRFPWNNTTAGLNQRRGRAGARSRHPYKSWSRATEKFTFECDSVVARKWTDSSSISRVASVSLGYLNPTTVKLIADHRDHLQLFLVVLPSTRQTLRISIDREFPQPSNVSWNFQTHRRMYFPRFSEVRSAFVGILFVNSYVNSLPYLRELKLDFS